MHVYSTIHACTIAVHVYLHARYNAMQARSLQLRSEIRGYSQLAVAREKERARERERVA